jgi:hypothetical protein
MPEPDATEFIQPVTAVDRRLLWRGRIRGASCILAIVLGPVVIGGTFLEMRPDPPASSDDISFADAMAFYAAWGWGNFVYPHPSIVDPRPGRYGYDAVVRYPAAVAIFQWALIASLFGWIAQKWKFRWQFPAALATVIIVSLMVTFGLELFGWELQIDGP